MHFARSRQRKRLVGELEVLAWVSSGDVKKSLSAKLKEEGYSYTLNPPLKADADILTLFACEHKDSKRVVLGMWVNHRKQLVLVWAPLTPEGAKGTAAGEGSKSVNKPTVKTSGAGAETPVEPVDTNSNRASDASSEQPIVIEAANPLSRSMSWVGPCLPYPSFLRRP